MSKKERAFAVRNYALITYHSEEVINSVLSHHNIRHWAYILHDKDKKDGTDELKEKHFHLLINLNNNMTESAVRKLFPEGQSTLAQPVKSKYGCWNYLTHADTPEKYQYSSDLVKCDDLKYWQGLQENGDDNEKFLNILRDIIARVPLIELAKRYGRDVIINYDKYRTFAHAVDLEETPFTPPDRCVLFRDETGTVIFDGATGEKLRERR